MNVRDSAAVLRLRGVSKLYGETTVLHQIDFDVAPGEVHGLVGGNGAGKSTMVKILSGAIRPSAGEVVLEGAPAHWSSPLQARTHGIQTMYQELDLIDELTVGENLYLDSLPKGWLSLLNYTELWRRSDELLNRLNIRVGARQAIKSLPVGQRQMVYLAKMLTRSAKVLIMDEPTASLSAHDQEHLHAIVRQLRQDGVGIVFISHKLEEVMALSDRITVIRDGRMVTTVSAASCSRELLVEKIIGDQLAIHEARPARLERPAQIMLDMQAVSGQRVREVTLSVRAGEVVGLTGLVGAGHEELPFIMAGAAKARSGRLLFAGAAHPGTVEKAVRQGIFLVPEDRKIGGIFPQLGVAENIVTPTLWRFMQGPWVRWSAIHPYGLQMVQKLKIEGYAPRQTVGHLSGGNQQKTLLARYVHPEARLLLLAEPTRGVDVKGRQQIHRTIRELADRGLAVVVSSYDVDEIMELTDYVYCFYEGAMVMEAFTSGTRRETVLRATLGGIDK